jgi:hypothetical protein
MEFLKKHYEKIVLGVVLAGLVGALVFMPFYISSDNAATEETTRTIIMNPSAKELTNLDLSLPIGVSTRLRQPYKLDLETTNRLFNPMEWQKLPDGTIVPMLSHIGPQMVVVTNITPLYLIVSLRSVVTNEIGVRYSIGIERQAEKTPGKRREIQRSAAVGDKANDLFSQLQIKGAPESPDEISLKLLDSGDVITFTREKPFRRIEAYAADFRYDPEKKVFRAKRAGEKVSFNGIDFIVDDVNQDELVLQDLSNQKKTSRPLTP